MILIIDNYDSFVYNLVRYVTLSGGTPIVERNDAVSVSSCLSMRLAGVIISPGPKRPEDAGISMDLIAALPPTIPLLGVCLGHQCLVEHFGGRTERAIEPLHGQSSLITHNRKDLFHDQPQPMMVGRYHSLISKLAPTPGALIKTAQSEQGEVMAVQHQDRPWFGVQFHPESVLTPTGFAMIAQFVSLCRQMECT